jgi:hemerythrin superfamily protein
LEQAPGHLRHIFGPQLARSQEGISPNNLPTYFSDQECAMNVIKLLKTDHDTVKTLFDKFDKAAESSYDRKAEIFEQVRRELLVHSQAEEEIFYPAIKAIEGGRELIVEALKEHKEVDELLTQISRLEPKDPKFTEKVEILMDNVDHHVEEEEGQIFQFAEENCPKEQLESLGIEIQERKTALERQLAA